MTEFEPVNKMAEVFSLLPSLQGREFTINDVKEMIGEPHLSTDTMRRLVKQGYLEIIEKSAGKKNLYIVKRC